MRFLAVSVLAALLLAGCSAPPGHEAEEPAAGEPAAAAGVQYTCPMHPDFVTNDADARCPECGMKLEAVTYTCPMHPDFVTNDADARCPECGMKLERVKKGGEEHPQTQSMRSEEMSDAVEMVFNCPGITCEGCAGHIKKTVGGKEGVASVAVDVSTKNVTVRVAPDGLSEEAVKGFLAEAGYPAS